MHGVFKNSIQFIKKMFREAPFLSWCVVYLFFLSAEWSRIDLRLSQYHFIIRSFLLSVIPLTLWWHETRKNRKAYKLRISTFRESRILPKHDIDHLKALFPDSQIDLFERVLLPSLSMFYVTFSEISQEGYYKEKIEAICKKTKELKQNPVLYSNQPQYKYRDIALTAFSFYRTLFDGAIEFFYKNATHKAQIDQTDTWVLLKRVPAKLSLILGAQYWRLYEFWEAVYGDPSSLRLNSDIIDYLTHDDNVSAIQKIAPAEATDVSDINQEKQPIQENTKPDKNEDINKQLTDKFIIWLLKKINSDDKRYRLNSGDYIFISPLLYDASVFITESLLNKYYKISGVSPDNLKQALMNQRALDGKQYFIENTAPRVILMRLNNLSIQNPASKTVSIKEVTAHETR